MHGMIFAELKKFVIRGFGEAAWQRISQDAGVTRTSNLATESYPDAEFFALVASAEKLTGIPRRDLLRQFGEFIVPDLMKVFGAFVDRNWTAMDLLQHTESVIHRAVRLQDDKAAPPKLRIQRTGPDEVTIVYTSARQLCDIAVGITLGVAAHYGEHINVEQTTCMHDGASQCTLIATRRAAAAA